MLCALIYTALAILIWWMGKTLVQESREYDRIEKLLEENNGNRVSADCQDTREQ